MIVSIHSFVKMFNNDSIMIKESTNNNESIKTITTGGDGDEKQTQKQSKSKDRQLN
jgi:hypothetical protein